jgi:hypothetical protein
VYRSSAAAAAQAWIRQMQTGSAAAAAAAAGSSVGNLTEVGAASVFAIRGRRPYMEDTYRCVYVCVYRYKYMCVYRYIYVCRGAYTCICFYTAALHGGHVQVYIRLYL